MLYNSKAHRVSHQSNGDKVRCMKRYNVLHVSVDLEQSLNNQAIIFLIFLAQTWKSVVFFFSFACVNVCALQK